MKKLLAIFAVLCLLLLCACRSQNPTGDETTPSADEEISTTGDENSTTEEVLSTADGVVETTVADGSEETTSAEDEEVIDWEFPIDVDDSFVEGTTNGGEEGNSQDPTKPSENNVGATEPSSPEEQNTTEAPASEELNSEPVESQTTAPSSGVIELPMIPG